MTKWHILGNNNKKTMAHPKHNSHRRFQINFLKKTVQKHATVVRWQPIFSLSSGWVIKGYLHWSERNELAKTFDRFVITIISVTWLLN